MSVPAWPRPAYRPRLRRAVLAAGGLATVAAAATAGALLAPVERVPTPVPLAPALVVTPVPVPVPVPAPAPPAPPAPPVDEAPPRAARPTLAAHCVLLDPGLDERPASCAWDDGFPAVSADGRLVATRFAHDGGEVDFPGESIHLIDVRTSRVVRDLVLYREREVPRDGDLAPLRARVARRAAAAQRVLDAGGFRPMTALAEQGSNDDEARADRRGVHAELDGARVRAIDPDGGRVLWQHDFSAPAPRVADPDADCSGWTLADTALWWDPTSRVALATLSYTLGGCMCGDATVEQVRRMR